MIFGAIFALVRRTAWKCFCLAYGLSCLLAMVPIAVFRDGVWFTRRRKMGKTERKELLDCKYPESATGFRYRTNMRPQFGDGTGTS